MNQKEPVSVLVAPLNWGLGHATRCIPIITELNRQGARVLIAAVHAQKTLLKQEFPQNEFLEIPGYDLRYKRGRWLKWAIFFRIPFMLKQKRIENKWLRETIKKRKIDAVISDNRYGLFHDGLFCVFITHQLYIQSGFESADTVDLWKIKIGRWVSKAILIWNNRFIGKFSACWVPDQKGNFSIAGNLSHPPVLPAVPVSYIGILSRFEKSEKRILANSLLILLSGPEPQRTDLENILLKQLATPDIQTVVVRGLPGGTLPAAPTNERIKIFNHLPSDELNELLNESEYIIVRSGYSSIMDLLKLRKNAIVIPTPGQTEQEYLARYLHEKKWMYYSPQKDFDLQNTLSAFKNSTFQFPEISDSPLVHVVEDFLKEIALRNNVLPANLGKL
jgi:spore coat polysaccharide biosynthesis predicted glycosyltransferase SpsG